MGVSGDDIHSKEKATGSERKESFDMYARARYGADERLTAFIPLGFRQALRWRRKRLLTGTPGVLYPTSLSIAPDSSSRTILAWHQAVWMVWKCSSDVFSTMATFAVPLLECCRLHVGEDTTGCSRAWVSDISLGMNEDRASRCSDLGSRVSPGRSEINIGRTICGRESRLCLAAACTPIDSCLLPANEVKSDRVTTNHVFTQHDHHRPHSPPRTPPSPRARSPTASTASGAASSSTTTPSRSSSRPRLTPTTSSGAPPSTCSGTCKPQSCARSQPPDAHDDHARASELQGAGGDNQIWAIRVHNSAVGPAITLTLLTSLTGPLTMRSDLIWKVPNATHIGVDVQHSDGLNPRVEQLWVATFIRRSGQGSDADAQLVGIEEQAGLQLGEGGEGGEMVRDFDAPVEFEAPEALLQRAQVEVEVDDLVEGEYNWTDKVWAWEGEEVGLGYKFLCGSFD
ncbi:hypothetical protein EVG20_g8019 [Dentipellis fragilis]|uniref:Uncharacterized protein n=1 Tax=Dentipellis fragilis TaxID=205917 RepID=A0A4Y9Y8W9_9AGAM|nr:hypothetical protein EVG20_g8019 [Dentipellis fragilis]